MIDHVGIKVSDYAKSKAFYLQVLATLGHECVMEITPEMTGTDSWHAGFGSNRKPSFWISQTENSCAPIHIAFTAATRNDVDAFYQAALTAGGKDNGAPGLRPHYHSSYYGAFIIDRDGNNIEAVCHSA
jgi:catechol 2,3-dioxygenase-like lactoylglutathione lyase family enzyme